MMHKEIRLRTVNMLTVIPALVALSPICSLAQVQHTPIPEQPSTSPQIEVDGSGIVSLELRTPRNTLPDGTKLSTTRINFTDSSLLVGISDRLYRQGGIGSFVIGTTATDGSINSSSTGLMLNQLYLDYSTAPLEVTLGRTDVATRLIGFPTLRSDDLVEFTRVLDPNSNGNNVEEQSYGNVASVTYNSRLRYFVNLHAQHLINTVDSSSDQTGINSYGLNLVYEGVPALTADEKVPTWGIGYEHQDIPSANGGGNDVLYGGLVYNIAPNPVNRVDVRLQDVYSTGNTLTSFGSIADTYRAAANSVAVAFRYLHSPFGKPSYQVALTMGFRKYQNVDHSGTYALALTGVKRLGDGFDLIAQYSYQHRASAYAAPFGGADDNSIQLGLAFNFNSIFHRFLGSRRSLLNLQHQYIPD